MNENLPIFNLAKNEYVTQADPVLAYSETKP